MDPKQEAPAQEEPTQEQPELTVEDKAREMGWSPKEDFEGDESKWVSAETFVARKPLFDKIESQSKYIKSVEKSTRQTQEALQALAEHHKKVALVAFKKELGDLKTQRRAALAEGDTLAADDIQEKIDNLKPESVPDVPAPTSNTRPPEIQEWVDANPWYDNDEDARALADAIGQTAYKKGVPAPEVLKLMRDKVAKAFPELVGVQVRNKNKDTATPMVGSTTGVGNASRAAKGFRPTEAQVRIAKTFVGQGLFKSVEDYYKELAQLGE